MVCIKTRVAALLSLLVLCGLAPALVRADQTVEVLVYYSPECSHCTFAHDTILQPLSQAYGDRLIMTYVDITQAEGLAQLEAIEKRLASRAMLCRSSSSATSSSLPTMTRFWRPN